MPVNSTKIANQRILIKVRSQFLTTDPGGSIKMTSKAIKNSYWVVPGEIMAGAFPGSYEDFNAKLRLRSLFDEGIRAFINLQEEGEMARSDKGYNENYWDFFRIFLKNSNEPEIDGGLVRRFSIPDKSVPSVELMKEILNEIDELHSKKIPLYIHCWGGLGRTATVVGCWMMRHGIAERSSVIDEIFTLRSIGVDPAYLAYRSPETDEQERFILAWKKGE